MKTIMQAKSTKIELKDINDQLLELYNTRGMALHFKYFMMGVDEANGWLEYEVIDENE